MGDTSYANDYATGIEEVDTDALQDRADVFTRGILQETGKAFEIDVIRDGYDYFCNVMDWADRNPRKAWEWKPAVTVPSLAEAIEYVEKVTA